ncbi:MAG: NUDIX hydrolase [Clostridia bacterium]|nr:NUDIX hydrolase [Clostridia bacterium]
MHSEIKAEGKRIYVGKVLKLDVDTVILENGKTAQREIVRHRGACAVLAVDENDDFYLVRQFRYPYGKEMLEIPAGKLDEGEEPLVCAKRELLEETGLVAEKWDYVGGFCPSPGYTDEIVHIYIARELSMSQAKPDEDEFLDVEKYNIIKIDKMIDSGEITDAKTVLAIYKYALSER